MPDIHPDADRLAAPGGVLIIGKNHFDITTFEGRLAARAFAWGRAAEGDEATYRAILALIGKEE